MQPTTSTLPRSRVVYIVVAFVLLIAIALVVLPDWKPCGAVKVETRWLPAKPSAPNVSHCPQTSGSDSQTAPVAPVDIVTDLPRNYPADLHPDPDTPSLRNALRTWIRVIDPHRQWSALATQVENRVCVFRNLTDGPKFHYMQGENQPPVEILRSDIHRTTRGAAAGRAELIQRRHRCAQRGPAIALAFDAVRNLSAADHGHHHATVDHVFTLFATISRDQGTPWQVDRTRAAVLWVKCDKEVDPPKTTVLRYVAAFSDSMKNTPFLAERVVVGVAGWTPMLNGAYQWHRLRHAKWPRPVHDVSSSLLAFGDFVARSNGAPSKLSYADSLAVAGGYILVVQRRENRRIVNADELLAALQRNFENVHGAVVVMEDYELRDHVRLFAGARAVIATHGAQWVHNLWMRPGAVVFDIESLMCDYPTGTMIRAVGDLLRTPVTIFTPTRAADMPAWTDAMTTGAYEAAAFHKSPCLEFWWSNL